MLTTTIQFTNNPHAQPKTRNQTTKAKQNTKTRFTKQAIQPQKQGVEREPNSVCPKNAKPMTMKQPGKQSPPANQKLEPPTTPVGLQNTTNNNAPLKHPHQPGMSKKLGAP